MKKFWIPGLPVLFLVLGLVITGCGNPSSTDEIDYESLIMRSTVNGKVLEITISRSDTP